MTQGILEPLGHIAAQSKFERVWAQVPKAHAIKRRRVERFDPVNMVAVSPIAYEFEPLVPLDVELSDQDLMGHFMTFVRDEFGATQGVPELKLGRVVEREPARIADLLAYLERSEEFAIYGPYMKRFKRQRPDIGEFMYDVLCDKVLGNDANAKYLERSSFLPQIADSIRNQERPMFVFLGFPFKDQNGLRVDADSSHVDYAELGMLIQLHMQALALFQRHPFGVDYIILSDGTLYSKIFGVERSAVEDYLARLRLLRNTLNLQGSVHIVDLEDCLLRLPMKDVEQFQSVRNRVRHLLTGAQGEPVSKAFGSLAAGMRRNINTRQMLRSLEPEEAARIVYADDGSVGEVLAMDIRERAHLAAVEYGATNVALRAMSVVSRVFHGAFRATIHAKQGQVAVPRSGGSYPWNGVGVLRQSESYPRGIQCHSLSSLGTLATEWITGYLPGDQFPSYYRPAVG